VPRPIHGNHGCRQLDLSSGLRRGPFVGDDDTIVDPCVGHEPTVRTGRELGLCVIEVLRVPLDPHHNIGAGARDFIGVDTQEIGSRQILLDLADKVLRLATNQKLTADSLDAEQPTFAMATNQTLSDPRAEIEGLVGKGERTIVK